MIGGGSCGPKDHVQLLNDASAVAAQTFMLINRRPKAIQKSVSLRGETIHAIKEMVSCVSCFDELVRDTTYRMLPVTAAADEQFFMRLYQGNLLNASEKEKHLASAGSGVNRDNFYDDLPDWVWNPAFRDDPF